ncbi:MAG TPA: DNA polymerase I, partial [Deltaproteobacteria bacterium]|nr:DNA polymerase I [Deltaproteobacteria bacterium]
EVMGLMGDPSDNIPGVKGIGEKTAIALIQRYHSLENLYDHLQELEKTGLKGIERIRKALVAGKDAAFLSRKLATVRTDVPVQLTLEDLHYQGWQSEKLRELFVELNFTKLIEGLDANNLEQA